MGSIPNIGALARERSPRTRETLGERRTTIWADFSGRILECSNDVDETLGYEAEDLVGSNIAALIPKLADAPLLQGGELNPRLAYRCRCGDVHVVDGEGNKRRCGLCLNMVSLRSAPALALIVVQTPREG
jgi:hypothetical protein